MAKYMLAFGLALLASSSLAGQEKTFEARIRLSNLGTQTVFVLADSQSNARAMIVSQFCKNGKEEGCILDGPREKR